MWPMGLCGSLAHTSTHVGALVATASTYRSVGIDVADARPLGNALTKRVLTSAEKDELCEISRRLQDDEGNLAFCAKEAFFKCQFSVYGILDLDFPDVTLRGTENLNELSIELNRPGRTDLYDMSTKTTIYMRKFGSQLVCWAALSW
jgi:4'-phosphopantetheinyl transferase EntD